MVVNEKKRIMRLAIVGSHVLSEDQLIVAHCIVRGFISVLNPKVIISGGADGVDTIAKEEAIRKYYHPGEHFFEYLPRYKRWEPYGYKERNIIIAEKCTHLLCIRDPNSSTYGSGWTADYAEDLGKKVWRQPVYKG